MTLLLFFDDKNLLVRDNLKEVYENPEPLHELTYKDPMASTSLGFSSVWKNPETGKYHMFYQGVYSGHVVTLAAISDDGMHFVPRNTAHEAGIVNPLCANQLFPLIGEMCCVFVDHLSPPEKRLKALLSVGNPENTRILENWLFTSGDGIHWHHEAGIQWHTRGAEPGAACFYNEATEKYTIIQRQDGFMALETTGGAGTLCTIAMLPSGGELSVLDARMARWPHVRCVERENRVYRGQNRLRPSIQHSRQYRSHDDPGYIPLSSVRDLAECTRIALIMPIKG